MRKTFASFSFGCRVNQAEKMEIDRQLSVIGYQYSETNPDFYIINTCAVTQKAEREARQFIYQIRRKFPKTKIIVTGCAATKWINEERKIKEVDRMIGNKDKENISKYISTVIPIPSLPRERNPCLAGRQVSRMRGNRKQVARSLVASAPRDDKQHDKFINSGRLFLKIQDGCQRFCTYCIVPYLRGKPKSRKIEEIINQITCHSERNEVKLRNPRLQRYAQHCGQVPTSEIWKIPPRASLGRDDKGNVKEVILTAINTEAFGVDTGESFINLISGILHQTSISRLSFGSINPWSINQEFLSFYKKILPLGRLVNFFHIPLQSGSNKILKLMKRGYTKEEFMEKLQAIKKINPMAFIATDVIVGFPGETNDDFIDTYNFLKESPISRFHIFRFSPREGTAAYFLRKKYPEPLSQTKIKRAKILADLSKKKYQTFLENHIGKFFPALFLERRIDGFQESLLDNQISVFIKTSKDLKGEIKEVEIEKLKEEKLFGKIKQ